ncbi:MAG: DnaJ domain-containing protein [Deltaproteobacteria bacterium]|nr:DnaJ domain-containing protein [Deltaproteobacteria bacterium]
MTTQASRSLKSAGKKNTLCLSCGLVPVPKGRRRYCSDRCKRRLDFALYIATGLVRTLRANYAAFSYTEDILILDILPAGSDVISRFMRGRNKHRKVSDDLLDMIEEAGREWYKKEKETGSKWQASNHLLNKRSRKDISLSAVVPVAERAPRLNHKEKKALKILELTREQILRKDGLRYIKSAYRRKAMLHHPDRGDKSNKFIQINNAHASLLSWAQNPRFYSRRALPNSWCYDASRRRWAPPA